MLIDIFETHDGLTAHIRCHDRSEAALTSLFDKVVDRRRGAEFVSEWDVSTPEDDMVDLEWDHADEARLEVEFHGAERFDLPRLEAISIAQVLRLGSERSLRAMSRRRGDRSESAQRRHPRHGRRVDQLQELLAEAA